MSYRDREDYTIKSQVQWEYSEEVLASQSQEAFACQIRASGARAYGLLSQGGLK